MCVYVYTTAGRSMVYMSLRLFDDYDLFRSFQLDIVKFLRFIGESFSTRTSPVCPRLKHLQKSYISTRAIRLEPRNIMSAQCRHIMRQSTYSCATLTLTMTLTFDLLSWKLVGYTGYSNLDECSHQFWFFYAFLFFFSIRSPYGTDRHADRVTGKTRNEVC